MRPTIMLSCNKSLASGSEAREIVPRGKRRSIYERGIAAQESNKEYNVEQGCGMLDRSKVQSCS